jgi:hypothetical protein
MRLMAFEREPHVNKDQIPAFELRILRNERREDAAGSMRYRLALWQRTAKLNGTATESAHHLVTLTGVPLQVALDQVLDVLRREGYRSNVLTANQVEALPLGEETGVRLGLLFLSIKPLSKVVRMEIIAAGIRSMPSEEAYYWFGKCVRQKNRSSALRALRVLLSPE